MKKNEKMMKTTKYNISEDCAPFTNTNYQKRKLRWEAGGINPCLCDILLRNLKSWHSREYYLTHIVCLIPLSDQGSHSTGTS